MLAISCPKCFQSLAIREEALRSEVRCICGHRFIAEDPSSPSANAPPADGELSKATESHGSVVMSSALPTLLGIAGRRPGEANATSPSPPPVPPQGPIECPYCGCRVVDEAKLLGQSILCPKCHANFNAPDSEAENKRAAARRFSFTHVFAAAMLTGGIIALATGQSAGLWLLMFGLGIGSVVRTFYKPWQTIPAKPVVILGCAFLAWVVLEGAFDYRPTKLKSVSRHQLMQELTTATGWVNSLRRQKVHGAWNFSDERELTRWESEVASIRQQLDEAEQ
ncbi:MAG TPA: hypothetical protein VHX68_00270 [Planctomycetaceae bacterium]|jgi:hypothetical protein|nr:hypothetical protein [Planctomycetaceae bacterium]